MTEENTNIEDWSDIDTVDDLEKVNSETPQPIADTPENVRILNEKLGITSKDNLFNSAGVKSINELFEESRKDFELLCKDITSKKEEVDAAEKLANTTFDNFKDIDGDYIARRNNEESRIAALESSATAMANFGETIQSMKSLIERGNDIVGKLYDAIVHTDILDPDLLNSAAVIIHSVRESNDNLIQYNVQKMQMEHQFRMAIETEKLKQKNRLEMEFFKSQLKINEMEHKAKLKAEEDARKNSTVSVSISDNKGGGVTWNQRDIAELLRDSADKNNEKE